MRGGSRKFSFGSDHFAKDTLAVDLDGFVRHVYRSAD